MSIQVACRCGKRFKVKEHLAGKAVRCPECNAPLRIPDGATANGDKASAARGPGSGEMKIDAAGALARYEEAQRRKQKSLEEEAAYRSEQNKLIESYDQLAGKGKTDADQKAEAEGKKKRPTEVAPTKPTIITKIADAIGSFLGFWLTKYVIITALLAAGVIGSVKLVQFMTGGIKEQIQPQVPRRDRARNLLREVKADIAAKNWEDADAKLREIAQLDQKLPQYNRDYQQYRKEVDQGLSAADKSGD